MPDPKDSPAAEPREAPAISAPDLFHSFWSLGFVSLCGLAANVVLARWLLGVADMGHVRVVRSVVEFAAIPAGFGMAVTVAKFTADRRLSDAARGVVLRTAVGASLLVSLLVAPALVALTFWPGMLNDDVARRVVRVAAWIIPVAAVYRACIGHLQGLGEIRRVAVQQAARAALLAVLPAVWIAIMGFDGWAPALVTAELAALALAILAVLPGARLAAAGGGAVPTGLRADMLRFGSHMAATQTIQAMFVSVDVLCLDRFHDDPELIAQYGMATLIFGTTLLLPQSFIQSHFFRIAAQGHDPAALRRQFGRVFGRVMAGVVIAGVLGWACSPAAAWVLGPGYAGTGRWLGWLMPAFVLQSAGLLAGSFVIGAGRTRAHLGSMTAAAVVNLAACLLLIPRWGAAGAVAALTLTCGFRAALSLVILARHGRG